MSTEWQSSAWVEVGEEADHRVVLRICGEVDAASRPVIEPAIVAALASAPSVLLDLAKLTFCDSQGLAMFIGARQAADGQGTAIEMTGVSPIVRRVFEIAGLDTLISLAG